MKLELSRQILEKYSNIIEFHEDLCCCSPVVTCGRTDRQTSAFRNFTNVSNNEFFPTTVVEHRKHVEAVGCRTFDDGLIDMFAFDILLIPSEGAFRFVVGSKYMVTYRDRNAGRGHSVKIDNSSIARVEEFKYLGTTLTDQNSIQEEIKSRLKSGNACYHSV